MIVLTIMMISSSVGSVQVPTWPALSPLASYRQGLTIDFWFHTPSTPQTRLISGTDATGVGMEVIIGPNEATLSLQDTQGTKAVFSVDGTCAGYLKPSTKHYIAFVVGRP